jgi:hypothetical protein
MSWGKPPLFSKKSQGVIKVLFSAAVVFPEQAVREHQLASALGFPGLLFSELFELIENI